jgi:hypothetical protein
MQKAVKIFLLLILTVLFSCEEQGLIVSCPDCTKDEPLKTKLDIKLKASIWGRSTLIVVYEGNLEDKVIYSTYSTTSSSTSISVTINKKYTVTATYYLPDGYYVVVDSATPRVKYDKELCNDPCYFVYDKVLDLRYKNVK